MLYVHRAERTDRLADGLAEILREPPVDPFVPEIVGVPSKGIERWLAQRLSHHLGTATGDDGVCANVLFPSVTDLMTLVTTDDPWRPERLVWPLLDVIDQCVARGESRFQTLAAYLRTPGRRYATARHLAALFDSYGLHRPDMLRAWTAGEDTDDEDLAWQPELWRWLTKRMTVPSPADRLAETCEALAHDPARWDLPQRVSLFGLTRLPAAHATLLGALAASRDVHLWLPHSSHALWEKRSARNPLLRSLGKDARELQQTLDAAGEREDRYHAPAEPYPDTLLGRLQRSLATDEPLDTTVDRSIQVHACHGPDRQVEVLREVILGLLAADKGLEPRDILVMCPDIEQFAPLISASFGLGTDATHPAHRLRVRLADRALRQLNPLFGVVAHLLDLADARVTAAQVLDLAALPPIRRRFRFDEDDLDRLRELVVGSGVRWGLDAEHRQRFRVAARSNTWVAGLDRILLGVAMSEREPHWLGTALPLDDMDSGDVSLAGRLSELVDRLGATLAALTGEHPMGDWTATILQAVDALTAVSNADEWQLSQLRGELAELGQESAVLALADVRSVLAPTLRGSPTRANFRTGDLTICTMTPMRSVPHRVICVLGLDDGAFPRAAGTDGDDVLARAPRPGERDPRAEDRQLLLDALMAATDTLVLLYSGADERTNAPRPPAVPLDEILDALGRPLREQILTRHPLQPFDARNFDAAGPFSFDGIALAGAVAAAGERTEEPPFLETPLPPLNNDTVGLDDLHAFFAHPVKAFVRRRLGVSFSGDDDEPADGLPIELDALQKWSVGDRLLKSLLDGVDLERSVQAEWRRGLVPPGPLGRRLLDAVADEVRSLVDAAQPYLTGTPEAMDVATGRVAGTVGDVYAGTVVAVSYSKVSPKHRVKAWLNLLALTAGKPGRPWQAVIIGRGVRGKVCRSSFGPIAAVVAEKELADLVAMADEGLCEPLPFAVKASHAYAKCRLANGNPETALGKARDEWIRYEGAGENEDPAHRLVWGTESTLEKLDAARFDALAMRLWEPLCRAETMVQI